MRRYLRPSAVNGPVAAWGYTKAMMIKQILTICAALAAGSAGTSLALAQSYPVSPGPLYSTAPAPYQPGGYPSDYRRAPGAPDFDALEEDDDAPNAQSSTALPPPGPMVSPADPRYAFKEFYDRVRDKGFILYPGKLTQLETFRVGCIGAIGPDEMRQAVNAVRDTLREMGVRQVSPAKERAAA